MMIILFYQLVSQERTYVNAYGPTVHSRTRTCHKTCGYVNDFVWTSIGCCGQGWLSLLAVDMKCDPLIPGGRIRVIHVDCVISASGDISNPSSVK